MLGGDIREYEKFIGFFDIHIGFENKYVRGNLVEVPTHNAQALKAAFQFAADFQPDTFILGGDQIDCRPVSHWVKNKLLSNAGLTIKSQYDAFEDLVLEPIESLGPKRKIWLHGNHEDWLYDVVEEIPALRGMLEPDEYLELKKKNWEIYSTGEFARVGKLYFTHGDTLGRGRNVAARAVNYYRRNIRFGHYHTFEVATLYDPVDVTDTHTGVCVPCLSVRSREYAKNKPDNVVNGFIYGYVSPTGDFYDNIVVMTDNMFVAEGKLYGKE